MPTEPVVAPRTTLDMWKHLYDNVSRRQLLRLRTGTLLLGKHPNVESLTYLDGDYMFDIGTGLTEPYLRAVLGERVRVRKCRVRLSTPRRNSSIYLKDQYPSFPAFVQALLNVMDKLRAAAADVR